MPYQLSISAPDRSDASLRLSQPVYRIGSDADCEICLPQLPPRALTIFQRASGIHLLNRSRQVLQLGRQTVAAGATVEWKAGQQLVLGKIRLKLDQLRSSAGTSSIPVVSGAPGIGRGATKTDEELADLSVPSRQAASKGRSAGTSQQAESKSQVSQIAVIVCSLIAIVLMLGGSDQTTSSQQQKLHIVAHELDLVIQDFPAGAARDRLEHLARLVSQWDVARALQRTDDARMLGTESLLFCDSLLRADSSSPKERHVAEQLKPVLVSFL